MKRFKGLVKISTEDIDIEINDNTSGSVPLDETPAESEANDAEAVEEAISASDEVEEVLKMMREFEEVAMNYIQIGNHVNKMGITRPLLAIANVNGELGQALGLPLPHFEEDSLPTDITDDQLAEVPPEVAMEAIGEKISGYLSKAKNMLTSLGGKIATMAKTYGTLAGRLNNKLNKVADKVHGQVDEEATAAKTVKAFALADYKKFVAELNKALGQTFEIKGNETQLKWGAEALAMAGYKVTVEQESTIYLGEKIGSFASFDFVKSKETAIKAEKKALGELGWNGAAVKGMFEPTKALIAKIGDLKKFEKAFKMDNNKKWWDLANGSASQKDVSSKDRATAYGRWSMLSSAYYTITRALKTVVNSAVSSITCTVLWLIR